MRARDLAAASVLLLVALGVSAMPSRGSLRTPGNTAAPATRRVQPVRVWVTDGNVGALAATGIGFLLRIPDALKATLYGTCTGSWSGTQPAPGQYESRSDEGERGELHAATRVPIWNERTIPFFVA